jgi:hypothetical protein
MGLALLFGVLILLGLFAMVGFSTIFSLLLHILMLSSPWPLFMMMRETDKVFAKI